MLLFPTWLCCFTTIQHGSKRAIRDNFWFCDPYILTLISYFLKVEELGRADTHRQVGIDIDHDESSQAVATGIPPIHHQ